MSENPISEGGVWGHLDTGQTVVQTEVINGTHVAHGTQPSSRPANVYNDSSAYLKGLHFNPLFFLAAKLTYLTVLPYAVGFILKFRENLSPFE